MLVYTKGTLPCASTDSPIKWSKPNIAIHLVSAKLANEMFNQMRHT